MNWNYQLHYARFHSDSPEHLRSMIQIIRSWIEPHLPADRSARILDVGCGQGYALATLHEIGFVHGHGIDSSPEQVAWAKARGRSAELVTSTPDFLSARPGTFDTILLMDVLEHVPRASQRSLLTAISGSLKPGGRLILTTPNALARIAAYTRYLDYTHETMFSPESLDYLLRHSGFAGAHHHAIEAIRRPRYLFFLPSRRAMRWWLLCLFRAWRRLELIAELGLDRAGRLPVTPALLTVAEKAGPEASARPCP